jgi:hypothetical protein
MITLSQFWGAVDVRGGGLFGGSDVVVRGTGVDVRGVRV